LPKDLDEMLIKSIDIAISERFVKHQRHHGRWYIWLGYSFVLLYTSVYI